MNYRHAYHAGNFADVMKHLALVLALDHLRKKEVGFCVIDAHGGSGLYDLSSIEAQKTREWQSGIGAFADFVKAMPDDFRAYYDLVKTDVNSGYYPGSPLLTARMLRPQDRLIANELHPMDVETLRDNLYGYDGVRVTQMDAYECIRAQTPPKEKRGLVLIDPPFEKKDEFETLIRQMSEWKKRFATGIFILWYPVKAHLPVGAMKRAAEALGMPRTWCMETLRYPRETQANFNGSGLIIFNTPYLLPERLQALAPFLCDALSLHSAPCEWLT